MPQVTVEYSDTLASGFDRKGFATALHADLVETAAAKPEACKTRFVRTEDVTVGPDTEGHAHVHVSIALLPGRTDETKARLTEAALDLLRTHLRTGEERLHTSAEVRELDPSYRKFEG
ncbi:5-carboxymethyl-2-hydroxymuconate isomerase [Streptomyces sp. B3I7]|jgi:5-carboxymethyl-2-hydroxymuconate isomerase|uniref:5-carboxymethyl-2-hydroxymuconate Delta-isomerase n=1 Tax=unclassified Streptomyces TaxID=2593676 RepID=UPI0027875418|nr:MULTISPECIES: isomerase [unclassified Streptomyces]MDQ0786571.1 5-carboxymethyl-2-hydroxymuconate isomerase [Streptomyces sp. B3I8]MDQ0813819.1 5-carboxymethyl-2-hydroxymuconate isomerase [Streptomyces sp. B3I7]